MAVSSLTNIVFINQNMHVAAGVQTSQFNRYDLQNLAAEELVNEKEKIVEEVRPIEETYKIDPNQEHEKEKAKEQEREHKSSSHKQNDDTKNKEDIKEESITHLDIRI